MATMTTGGAVLGLLTGLGKALATGLAAAKPPEEGCGECDADKARRTKRQRPRRRSRRR